MALAGTLALVSGSTLIIRAEDAPKQEAPKAPESAQPTYSVSCGAPCDFTVSSHDKAEVIAIVKEHAKTHHNMELSDKDVEAMVKVTETKK